MAETEELKNLNIDLSEFTADQIEEIKQGLKEGLDVSVYAKKEFLAAQMMQLRLGLENNISVLPYCDPQFDWFQMEEIRKGIERHVDYESFARPEYPYAVMRELRKALEKGLNFSEKTDLDPETLRELRKATVNGFDISTYIEKGFNGHQLHEITYALSLKIKPEKYITPEYPCEAMHEVFLGLEHNVSIKEFNVLDYNWQQMREIRLGLEMRLDINEYSNPLYEWNQMQEIRLGLESGVDISLYKDMSNAADVMKASREKLEEELLEALKQSPLTEDELREQFTQEIENIISNVDKLVPKDLETPVFITLSKDNMAAYLTLQKDFAVPSFKDVHKTLQKLGVVYGIDNDAILDTLKKNPEDEPVNACIAKGREPVNGTDGWYEYFFNTNPVREPKLLEDGSVDYKSVDWFEPVHAGQVIAKYHQSLDGKNGMTLKGTMVPYVKAKEEPVLTGQGFVVSEDKCTYTSVLDGCISIKGHNVSINNIMEIDEVGLSTGNVAFSGSVHIKGNVYSGYEINATEDIIVDGYVESAILNAGHNIVLKNGINASGKGYLNAQGDISGKFFEAVDVHADGNISANYCLNSTVYAGGKVFLNNKSGMVAGGKTMAVKGMEINNLGNQAEVPTAVRVGNTDEMLEDLKAVTTKVKRVEYELKIFNNAYDEFTEKYPPEVRSTMDIFKKLEDAIYTKELEMKKFTEIQEDIENTIESNRSSKINVLRHLYNGVTITIEEAVLKSTDTRSCTIQYEDCQVVIV